MTLNVLAAGVIAALLMTSAAHAATVANRDDVEIKIVVFEGSSRQEHLILPGKAVEGVCQKGCIVRLNDSVNGEYELDGSESVSVDEGFLYYDSPISERAPQDGSTQPSGAGQRK
ncbi:MAG: hypothetical protein ACRCS9_00575 [Hyphomicrobium sp.]